MIAFMALLKGLSWRLIGAVALVVAVALAGWRISTWRDAYKALPGVQDALAREEACADGSECSARQKALQEAAEHEREVVVAGLQAELDAIRARPPVVIRVPAAGGPVRNAGAPAGADAGTAAAWSLPGPAAGDRDIGPALSALALEADEVTATCRQLQHWNRALAAPHKDGD